MIIHIYVFLINIFFKVFLITHRKFI